MLSLELKAVEAANVGVCEGPLSFGILLVGFGWLDTDKTGLGSEAPNVLVLALLLAGLLGLPLIAPSGSIGGGLELKTSLSSRPFDLRPRFSLGNFSGDISGGMAERGPGVNPPKKPFQYKPGPAGEDSGMNFDGATSVDGGASLGF